VSNQQLCESLKELGRLGHFCKNRLLGNTEASIKHRAAKVHHLYDHLAHCINGGILALCECFGARKRLEHTAMLESRDSRRIRELQNAAVLMVIAGRNLRLFCLRYTVCSARYLQVLQR
jgi:hypothetical protein